jgi:hypothetical protein
MSASVIGRITRIVASLTLTIVEFIFGLGGDLAKIFYSSVALKTWAARFLSSDAKVVGAKPGVMVGLWLDHREIPSNNSRLWICHWLANNPI